jgi:hypothetical protein
MSDESKTFGTAICYQSKKENARDWNSWVSYSNLCVALCTLGCFIVIIITFDNAFFGIMLHVPQHRCKPHQLTQVCLRQNLRLNNSTLEANRSGVRCLNNSLCGFT